MGVVGNQYVGASQQIIANGDTANGCNVVVASYGAVVADSDARLVAICSPCRQLQTALENIVVADAYVLTASEMIERPAENRLSEMCNMSTQVTCI